MTTEILIFLRYLVKNYLVVSKFFAVDNQFLVIKLQAVHFGLIDHQNSLMSRLSNLETLIFETATVAKGANLEDFQVLNRN